MCFLFSHQSAGSSHLLQLDFRNTLFLSFGFIHAFAGSPASLFAVFALIVALTMAGLILIDLLPKK